MSLLSHTKTPSVISSPVATSPKYSMSGMANEINSMKSKNGYLSTLFGHSERGTAGRDYSKIFPANAEQQKKKPYNIFS